MRILTLTAVALVAALICVIAVSYAYHADAAVSEETDDSPQSEAGRNYILKQEAVPVTEIEDVINRSEQEALNEKQSAALREELFASPDSIFKAISSSGTVLVGESRTSGFSAYGFLDANHVLGGIGWSIQEIPALYDQLASMQPKNVIFSFGINELGRYPDTPVYYYAPEIFVSDLNEFIKPVIEAVPGVNIYVNCIVPCTQAVYDEFPGYGAIPEWNKKIAAFCEENGYHYIDISDLCAEHPEMYREDGTHLISDFYPLWGGRILEELLKNEQ